MVTGQFIGFVGFVADLLNRLTHGATFAGQKNTV
jgi:hypothetical protein